MFDCSETNSIEVLFRPLVPFATEIFIVQWSEDVGGYISWVSSDSENQLMFIVPDEPVTINFETTGILNIYCDKWSWDIPMDTWVGITFVQQYFDSAGSDAPEDIVAEAVILGYEVVVFQEQDGEPFTWWSEREENELTNILPNVCCSINIDHDHILVIGR